MGSRRVAGRRAAGEIVKAVWPPATRSWTVHDPLGVDHAATALEKGRLSAHDLVVGRPVERLGDHSSLGPELADSLGYAAARTVPLVGDPLTGGSLVTSRLAGAGLHLLAGWLLSGCPMVKQRASTSGRIVERSLCRWC